MCRRKGLEVYIQMGNSLERCPAKSFAERVDDFESAAISDRLTLDVSRDSREFAVLFNKEDEAVKWMIDSVLREPLKAGLCRRAPRSRTTHIR